MIGGQVAEVKNYVVVDENSGEKIGGPYLWDGVTPWTPPEKGRLITEESFNQGRTDEGTVVEGPSGSSEFNTPEGVKAAEAESSPEEVDKTQSDMSGGNAGQTDQTGTNERLVDNTDHE
jgi:hypothetical protein